MALILNIDCATEKASIALSDGGATLSVLVNEKQKDHAAWMHEAIAKLLAEVNSSIQDLKAVGVTAGPGSYTGLRVAMATAKGLCYALNVPLLTVNTLEAMASAALVYEEADLYCPMIDARRMEVFTALYGKQMERVQAPCALVVDEHSFTEALAMHRVLFFGSGAPKLQVVLNHSNALFSPVSFDASALSSIINKKFNLSDFADLTYSEPVYLKEFYSPTFNKR